MPYDNASRHNHRYEIQLRHQHRFTPQITGGIHFNQVSDDDYYRDFYGRNDIAENVNLNRSLWLNYTGNAWGGDVQAAFLVRKYQTLAGDFFALFVENHGQVAVFGQVCADGF